MTDEPMGIAHAPLEAALHPESSHGSGYRSKTCHIGDHYPCVATNCTCPCHGKAASTATDERTRRKVSMERMDIDSEIQVAVLGLALGLPSRCECPAPFEMRSLTLAATVCEWCGGLVATDVERTEG